MELSAAETTVSFEAYNTHTTIIPTVITFELSAKRIDKGKFTVTADGITQEYTSSLVTTWTYPSTVLELEFSARQTAFYFTGEGSTIVTIPTEHTHVTVDGIETAVDIPGFTTTLTVTGSSNIIAQIPATTAQMTIPEATYVFSAITDVVTQNGDTYYCGTFTDQRTYAGDKNGSPCIVGTTFTVTLPSDASALYLHGEGLTTSFALQGITTTFLPEQTVTIVKDGSTETSVIPAVVSTYTTTMSDTNVSSEESSMEPTITGPVTITVTVPGTTEPGTTEPGTECMVSGFGILRIRH